MSSQEPNQAIKDAMESSLPFLSRAYSGGASSYGGGRIQWTEDCDDGRISPATTDYCGRIRRKYCEEGRKKTPTKIESTVD
jgi:hypothetical protein